MKRPMVLVLAVIAMAAVFYGFWQWWPPAAWIAVGLIVLFDLHTWSWSNEHNSNDRGEEG